MAVNVSPDRRCEARDGDFTAYVYDGDSIVAVARGVGDEQQALDHGWRVAKMLARRLTSNQKGI